MKSQFLAGAALTLLLAACGNSERHESTSEPKGKQTETRSVEAFTGIVLDGAMSMKIVEGDKPSIVMTGLPSMLKRTGTTVTDGILHIDMGKGEGEDGVIVIGDSSLEAVVTLPKLSSLRINGAGNVDAKDLKAENLAVNIDGAAKIDLSGTCASAAIEMNGAGKVDARHLRCKSVSVTINGAGKADVYANESAALTLNGIGKVDVYGNPKQVNSGQDGIGSIEVHHGPDAEPEPQKP